MDITLPFEENLLELIKLLMKLDIPLEASARDYPVLNAGGAMALINPELYLLLLTKYSWVRLTKNGLRKEIEQNVRWQKTLVCIQWLQVRRVCLETPMLIEIARGCMWSCKFCFYRQAYGAIRFVPKERVAEHHGNA